MRILAFDTATASSTAALLDTDTSLELEARDDHRPGERPRHATRLMALIVELLELAGGGWEAIDRIAVGVGPGTFTGLRIGVATARALAQSRSLPLIGVSTLRSLAANAVSPAAGAAEVASDAVLAVIDARRGEAFVAAWRLAAQGAADGPVIGQRLVEQRVVAPAALAELVAQIGQRPLVLGSGAVEFRSQLERSGAMIPADDSELHRVTSRNHCQLAARPCVVDRAGDILPEYLRLPDAELARRRRTATSSRPADPSDS